MGGAVGAIGAVSKIAGGLGGGGGGSGGGSGGGGGGGGGFAVVMPTAEGFQASAEAQVRGIQEAAEISREFTAAVIAEVDKGFSLAIEPLAPLRTAAYAAMDKLLDLSGLPRPAGGSGAAADALSAYNKKARQLKDLKGQVAKASEVPFEARRIAEDDMAVIKKVLETDKDNTLDKKSSAKINEILAKYPGIDAAKVKSAMDATISAGNPNLGGKRVHPTEQAAASALEEALAHIKQNPSFEKTDIVPLNNQIRQLEQEKIGDEVYSLAELKKPSAYGKQVFDSINARRTELDATIKPLQDQLAAMKTQNAGLKKDTDLIKSILGTSQDNFVTGKKNELFGVLDKYLGAQAEPIKNAVNTTIGYGNPNLGGKLAHFSEQAAASALQQAVTTIEGQGVGDEAALESQITAATTARDTELDQMLKTAEADTENPLFESEVPMTEPDFDSIQETLMNLPGYRFRFEQGQKALESSAAGAGLLKSGRFAEEMTKYGQEFATSALESERANLQNTLMQTMPGVTGTSELFLGRSLAKGESLSALGETLANASLSRGQAIGSAALGASQRLVTRNPMSGEIEEFGGAKEGQLGDILGLGGRSSFNTSLPRF